MTKKELINNIKKEIKNQTLSAQTERKILNRMKGTKEFYSLYDLCKKEYEEYICTTSRSRREWHIAYSLLKGRTMDQIEPNRRADRKYEHMAADSGAKWLLNDWASKITEETEAQ